MKICPWCDKKIPDMASYCMYCGKKLETDEKPSTNVNGEFAVENSKNGGIHTSVIKEEISIGKKFSRAYLLAFGFSCGAAASVVLNQSSYANDSAYINELVMHFLTSMLIYSVLFIFISFVFKNYFKPIVIGIIAIMVICAIGSSLYQKQTRPTTRVIYQTVVISKTPSIKITPTLKPEPTRAVDAYSTQKALNEINRKATEAKANSLDECRIWSKVSLDDVGKKLCVYGEVLDAYPAGDGAYGVSFGNKKGDFYLISYEQGWYIDIEGKCIKTKGEIKQLGSSPVIVIGDDDVFYCD